MQAVVRSWGSFLREHRRSLLVLLGVSVIAQAITLMQGPFIHLTPDSPSYIQLAQHILSTHQVANGERTPGYPLLLAALFLVVGSTRLGFVTVAQIFLTLLTVGEIYVLAYRLAGHKRLACGIAALAATNLFFLNWERTVMTECLSWWAIVTIFYVLERYIQTERHRYLALLTILMAFAILVRPFFIFVPFVLVLLLGYRALRQHQLRRQWLAFALALLVVYGIVVGDMANNRAQIGYFGLTYVSNINLFGKILEYHMEDATTNPRFTQIKTDAHAYVATGSTEPWRFALLYPADTGPEFTTLSAYSIDIMTHNPLRFLAKTVPDIATTLITRPHPYAPFSYTPFWVLGLLGACYVELLLAYLLLPFVAIWVVVRLRRDPYGKVPLIALAMLACTIGDIILTAVGSYKTFLPNGTSFTEFYRMRFPFDWSMLLLCGLMLFDGLTWLRARRDQPTLTKATESDEELAATMPRRAVHYP